MDGANLDRLLIAHTEQQQRPKQKRAHSGEAKPFEQARRAHQLAARPGQGRRQVDRGMRLRSGWIRRAVANLKLLIQVVFHALARRIVAGDAYNYGSARWRIEALGTLRQ